MSIHSATAIAHPNIAFIKYWGNRDSKLRLPANGSISMNLGGLITRTSVTFNPDQDADILVINDVDHRNDSLIRVSNHLDLLRSLANVHYAAHINSHNSFPTGVGLASSASAYAALTFAASAALGLDLSEKDLSRLARRGSGSACRSIPSGIVEWNAGTIDEDSYAFTILPPEHWDLIDCIAIVNREHKTTGSSQGHSLAATSPIQPGRVADTPRRLGICKQAILDRDFDTFACIVEQDSNLLHAVMMTSTPVLLYWQPTTIELMHSVQSWRAEGIPVCYTIDAGPNVHILTLASHVQQVTSLVSSISGVDEILIAPPGGPTTIA